MTLESPTDTIIYRSPMNPRIHRNCEVFTPTDFRANITQHIPDKGAQMVRYFGCYSNKMRGVRRRHLQGTAEFVPPPQPLRIPPPPALLPSRKWRNLLLKIWHADPLQCPVCGQAMRVIAVIDQKEVIEKILRHLGLWSVPNPTPARSPPQDWVQEPCQDVDPMPDYQNVLTD